jgi:hypothetical protein
MFQNSNCCRPDGDCTVCSAYHEDEDFCGQDDELGYYGEVYDGYSDADPGL